MNEIEKELLEAFREDDERKKKNFKRLSLFGYFAVAIFIFAMYMFFLSGVRSNSGGIDQYNDQGAMMYTFSLANPLSAFGEVNPYVFFGFMIGGIALLVIAIFLVVYSKMKKIDKNEDNDDNEKNVEEKNDKPIVEKAPVKTEENLTNSNKKVLELLDEGNRQIEEKHYSDARITYKKIREWYDHNNDSDKVIYSKIVTFYNRITKEEI